MSDPNRCAAGFVLVGGQSRRMGQNKALLEVDGQPLGVRTAAVLKTFLAEVTLLGPAQQYAMFGLPVIEDLYPGDGPLGAVYTGLKRSHQPWNLFFACDLPFLEARLVELLLQRALQSQAQAIVPVAGGRFQPLCAAYHRSCLGPFETAVRSSQDRSLSGVLATLSVETINAPAGEEPGRWERMFFNLNTAEQWEQFRLAAVGNAP